MKRGALLTFLAGGTVMALEILASRWLAPVLGFTLATWAWLISITLLAGALGAVWGGRLSRHGSGAPLGWLLGGAGLWIAGLAACAAPALEQLLGLPPALAAALGATLVLGPPVVALGAVLPVAVAITAGPAALGVRVGRLLAASTAGSLVGTLLAAFWMVPELGLRRGALVLAGLLLAAAVTCLRGGRRRGSALAVLLLLGSAVWILLDAPADQARWLRRQTPYGELTLKPGPGGGYLMAIDGIRQAGVSPWVVGPDALLGRRQYVGLLPYLHPAGRTALCVGLGGGLVSAALEAHGVRVESVEVNPVIVQVLRERFGFRGTVHIGDGRSIWRRLDTRFDFVILDAFQGESLPTHLVTREAFSELRERMLAKGVLCLHLIGAPGSAATAAIHRTLRDVFPHTLAVRSGAAEELQDVFLFASDGALRLPPDPALLRAGFLGNEVFHPSDGGAPLLTDDRNPIDVLNAPLAAALRAASR